MNDVDNRVLLAFKIILYYTKTLNHFPPAQRKAGVVFFLKVRYDLMTLAIISIQ